MPTKLGKGGHGQQEYVPEGNGEASGTYADDNGVNIYGSFKNFKKPTEGISGATGVSTNNIIGDMILQGGIDENQNGLNKSKTIEENINRLFKKPSPETEEFTKKIIEESNENIEILNKLFNENDKLTVNFGYAGRNAAGCAWGYSSVTMEGKNVHTYRHEMGHIFDAFYGKDLETNKDKYPFSNRLCTRYIDDEEGKCFDEVIHEELGIHNYETVLSGWKLTYRKRGIDKRETKIAGVQKVADIFDDYCKQLYDEEAGIKNAYDKRIELKTKQREAQDKATQEANNDPKVQALTTLYNDARKEVNREEQLYADEQMRKGASTIIYSESSKVVNAREKSNKYFQELQSVKYGLINDYTNKYFSAEDKATLDKLEKVKSFEIYKKVRGLAGIMGDTEDYVGVYKSKFDTNGHGSNYFNTRKDDGYSSEIWANMTDCYIQDKKQWDVLKKMFPRATGIFERAVNKYGR